MNRSFPLALNIWKERDVHKGQANGYIASATYRPFPLITNKSKDFSETGIMA